MDGNYRRAWVIQRRFQPSSDNGSLSNRIDASFLISRLYVSAEFTRTVKLRHGERNNFMVISLPLLLILPFVFQLRGC